MTIREINERLTNAGRLSSRIIGVYASDHKPTGAVPVAVVIRKGNPCLAKALFKMFTQPDVPAIYVSEETVGYSCPGLLMWFGYKRFPPKVENMFASDSPDANSMCIKQTSEICRATLRDIGTFKPIGKAVVLQALEDIDDTVELKSLLCFGNAEQIRNLSALIHFSEARAFTPIVAPWGSGCSAFVAFPAGMASGCPTGTAFLSPMVPESNGWLPANTMALGIPIDIAARMAEGYQLSFAVRSRNVAYIDNKEGV